MVKRIAGIIVFTVALTAAIFVLEEAAEGRGAEIVRKTIHSEVEFPGEETAYVVRVIDGDTIEVFTPNGVKEKVRYIGVNAPESADPVKSPQNGGAASAFNRVNPRRVAQCFGREAAERNYELVAGRMVRLARDVNNRDKYGRLLRYVYLTDTARTFVNLEIVRQGYAAVATYPPDIKYASEFLAAEREARVADRGLWGGCR